MSATKLLTVAIVAMLLLGGATAVSAMGVGVDGDLPEEANETANNSTATADMATDDPEGLADDANESVGPPGGLPEVVPDFVSDIHSSIDEFLAGEIGALGEVLSDQLTPSPA